MSYRIAIGTVDGFEISEHFSRAKNFMIVEIDPQSDKVKKLGNIEVIYSEHSIEGHDENLIRQKIQGLLDLNVSVILVKQIGAKAERMVIKNGIDVLVASGKIDDALYQVIKYYKRLNIKNV